MTSKMRIFAKFYDTIIVFQDAKYIFNIKIIKYDM